MNENVIISLSDDKSYLVVKTLSMVGLKVICKVTHDKEPEHLKIFLDTMAQEKERQNV